MQITVTAALGFDSFLVMRHGAGPFRLSHDLKDKCESSQSYDMEKLSLTAEGQGKRLGCYFCNDVVAPVDVIFLDTVHLPFHAIFSSVCDYLVLNAVN